MQESLPLSRQLQGMCGNPQGASGTCYELYETDAQQEDTDVIRADRAFYRQRNRTSERGVEKRVPVEKIDAETYCQEAELMKRVLLVSMMHNVTELFRESEPDLKGKTVTYIPTAAIAEEIEGMAEAIVEKYSSELELKVIDDYRAILVEDDEVSILPK